MDTNTIRRHAVNTGWGLVAGLAAGLVGGAMVAVVDAAELITQEFDPLAIISFTAPRGILTILLGAYIGVILGAIVGCVLSLTATMHHARLAGVVLATVAAVGVGIGKLADGVQALSIIGAFVVLIALPVVGYLGGTVFSKSKLRHAA